MATVQQVSAVLRDGPKTSTRVFSKLREIGVESLKILALRDVAQAGVVSISRELGNDPKKIDELVEKLRREQNRVTGLTKQLEELWAQSDVIIQPLADLTDAALSVAGAFSALEKRFTELNRDAQQEILDGASKVHLRLQAA